MPEDVLTRYEAGNQGLSRRGFLARTAGVGVAVGGLGVFGLSACGDEGGTVGEGGSYKGQQAVTHLDDIISPAPFHIAEVEGYFSEAKLELKSVSFPGGADVIRAIQSTAKMGLGATIATMIGYSKGFEDLRIVGGTMNASEVVFVVPADSPIRSPQDLNGKKIGVSEPGSNTTYFGNLAIDRYKLEGAKIVNVGGPPDALTAAQHGVIDVAWGTAPFTTQLVEEGKVRLLIDTVDLEPHWASTLLVSRQDFIDETPEVLEKWVGALGKAIDLIHSDPRRAGRAWARSIDIDPGIATAALEDYREAFSLEIDPKSLDSAVRAGKALDQLDEAPNLDELVDDQFVPAAAGA